MKAEYRGWTRPEREKWPLRPGFHRNEGKLPFRAKGKRVEVYLMNGVSGKESWPADGKSGATWDLDGSPFNIDQYRVV